MKHSVAFFATISLNALTLAVALAAISNHFVGWLEAGVILSGLLLQGLLCWTGPARVNWLVQHSIVGRLAVLGGITLLVLATSPHRSVQNLSLLLGTYTLLSTLLSRSSKLGLWKQK
ncbi:hypothetical protein GCM10028773_19860 [Spirosoma koreense]